MRINPLPDYDSALLALIEAVKQRGQVRYAGENLAREASGGSGG